MQTITSIDDAVALVGQELGVSGWKEIDQQRINDFADVTEDRQWIHTDVERAKAESQYGSTIAHGYLTLSLIPAMSKDNYRIMGGMTINYGLNKVRFLDAVMPGSRIRVRSELLDTEKFSEDTANLFLRHTVEVDGHAKPAAVVETITRCIF
jgi:acyl dehydratase